MRREHGVNCELPALIHKRSQLMTTPRGLGPGGSKRIPCCDDDRHRRCCTHEKKQESKGNVDVLNELIDICSDRIKSQISISVAVTFHESESMSQHEIHIVIVTCRIFSTYPLQRVQRYDFWYLALAPGPPNFFGSHCLLSATNRVRSY